MATTTFSRHHQRCLDAATHDVFTALGAHRALRGAFTALLLAAHTRSDLMRAAPVRVAGRLRFTQLHALRHLARAHRQALRPLDTWPGATGHPLAVVDSLAQHLLARYATPRFLASAWLAADGPRERLHRGWFVAHAGGARFRRLRLPLVMTRRMEHVFLRTPDHLDVDVALRRAEVIGLGGSPALAAAVTATRLGHGFADAAYWRGALAWLARREDEVALADVAVLIEHLHRVRDTAPALTGRPVAAVLRDARGWAPPRTAARTWYLHWPRSRWDDVTLDGWRVVELLDSDQLIAEGRALRHCVASYAGRCQARQTTIWSVRRVDADAPVLTVEVRPEDGAVAMVRGFANRRGTAAELALIQRWAAAQQLRLGTSVARELGEGGGA